MQKIDYKKELKDLYKASSKKCTFVEVSEMNYLMISGKGNPNNSQEFQEAVEGLYAVSYTLKFMSKQNGIDYVVMPLEGLWYMDNMEKWSMKEKDKWEWTLMIMQPNHITVEMVEEAIETVRKKKNPVDLSKVRFERYDEGLSAQVLHVGSYSDEPPTIERLHNCIKEKGYILEGKHHEIYLSDPRRIVPEKLKTIIRQPVKET